MEPSTDDRALAERARRSYVWSLLASGLAYGTFHHVGSLPGGLGTVGDTRWADWIDLLTPYAVLLPAAAALAAARSPAGIWTAFGVGALAYTQGHGVHLAANSVGNVAPGDAAHLWDEVVGHWLWYAGAAVVMAALAVSMRGRPRPQGPVPHLVALAVGLTWATNAFGGGTAPMSLAVALALAGYGWRHRDGLAVLLVYGFVPAAAAIAAYLAVGGLR